MIGCPVVAMVIRHWRVETFTTGVGFQFGMHPPRRGGKATTVFEGIVSVTVVGTKVGGVTVWEESVLYGRH